MTRAAGLALLLLALAAPAAASAAQPRLAALPSPLAALSATPPLGTGASAAAEGVRHHIDSTTRVRVAVDAQGTPFAVTATQRLVVSQPGDYYFTIGAPLTDVAPAYGSQSTPGLRTATIIWAGFNPGKRVLAARATLDPAAVAGSLPLRVSIGGGKVRLANATGITTTAFAADALKPQLEMFLAGLRLATRTGSPPTGGGALVTSQPVQTTVRVIAPLHVTGTIGSRPVDVRLGTTPVSFPAGRLRLFGLGAASVPEPAAGALRAQAPRHRRPGLARVRTRTPVRLVPRQPGSERVERLDLQLRLGDPARPGRERTPAAERARHGRPPALGLRRPGRPRRRRARLV